MTPIIEIGDFVQARLGSNQSIAIVEFTVTGIEEDAYIGSPLGLLHVAYGWSFEVIRKGDPGLPSTLSDLAVLLTTDQGRALRVFGPIAGSWQTETGTRINPADVLAWEHWSTYEANHLEEEA